MKLKRNLIKRGITVLAALCVLAFSVPSVYATEDNGETETEETKKQDDLDDLEQRRDETLDEIDNLKGSIGEVQAEIDRLSNDKKTIQGYIRDLDIQFDKLTKQITEFEGKIGEKEEDIETTKAELSQAKEECDVQYESMKSRIQFIYENPVESLFEMLITSDSISDFLNKADYVSSLSDYDRQMMDKLIEIRDQIDLKEQTLEAELEELKLMKNEVAVQKKKVNSSINKRKGELNSKMTELDDASGEKSDYKKQLAEQEKLLDEIEEQIARAANGNAYEGSVTGFVWPCPAYTRISSTFGPRPQPMPGASTNHKGIDLAAPYGSKIVASAAGVVTTSAYSASAGNYVVVSHGNGISTVYMHASALLVSQGETVEQGQTIARVGSTGYSTGNHLHFGVIKNGTYVNPMGYVSP